MSALLDATNFVETIENKQGVTISAPEEIAYINKWIDKDTLIESEKAYGKSTYGGTFEGSGERIVEVLNIIFQ